MRLGDSEAPPGFRYLPLAVPDMTGEFIRITLSSPDIPFHPYLCSRN